jgi:hypothetical protein
MVPVLQSDHQDPPQLTAGPILEGVLTATRQTQALLAPSRLQGTVEVMVSRAHALGISALYGASDAGNFLAGAMAHRSEQLHLWSPEDRGAVLVVDGVVAGLAGLHVAARRVGSTGAEHVDALVLGLLAEPGRELGTHISLTDASRAAA